MSVIDDLLEGIPIPRVVAVRQHFEGDRIDNIGETIGGTIRKKGVLSRIKPDMSIAITAGSRGIANLPEILAALVREVRKAGGRPFIVPAMGSHGGATESGQVKVLRGMGVTEQSVGAPIRSSMEVVRLGSVEEDLPVYIDRLSFEADGIIVVNRIKQHVAFRGKYESGLVKMIAIGLGKQKGADSCHSLGFGKMARNIESLARITLSKAKILFAVGLIENGYHETSRVEILHTDEILEKEPELQEYSKRVAPRIYFEELDVLIIDEIGKNIAGTGFDTNVVGRFHTPYASGGPNITCIAALDVTDISRGNANGLGILDFTTRRAFDKFDFEQTYPNSLTSTIPTSVKIPMVLGNDRQAVQAALKTCHVRDPGKIRLVRIKNTQDLAGIEASENMLPEIQKHPQLEAAGKPYDLPFDRVGNLI